MDRGASSFGLVFELLLRFLDLSRDMLQRTRVLRLEVHLFHVGGGLAVLVEKAGTVKKH